ncbi:MAG: class I SAM-dependent methyltransferase [Syntrophaceae bacterium]|nr:class I SAM-dependent methyltransferase [Syntrophaceae bacterium]
MKQTHENKVEKFYSRGSDTRGFQDGGFLSFGYWTEETIDYHQAAETLINRLLKSEKPLNQGIILNAACGYGAETIKIYEKIRPDKIIAIDITASHIEFAQRKINSLNLSDRIHFEKMDACNINFPPDSFVYVIAVEGPAHFNTREAFLRQAYKALKPSGILLFSDIVTDNLKTKKSLCNTIIANLCAWRWHMPKANWMTAEEIKTLLKEIGFAINSMENVGANVYPGFSRFNLKRESIKNAIETRGLRIGLLLTFISWLLGYVYGRKIIDYVLIKATKPS